MVTFGHGYLYRFDSDVTIRHHSDYQSRPKQKENHQT